MSFPETSIRRLGAMILALALAAPASSEVGENAAWEILTDLRGDALDVTEVLRDGRKVVFVFWQPWCGSCREEAPELVAAAAAHATALEFVGVISGPDDVVDGAKVTAAIRDWGLTYRQVRDRDAALARRFEVTGTPTIIVIGASGKPIYRGHRAPENWAALEESSR